MTRFRLDEVREQLAVPFDLFICCASYEDRSLSIANSIDSGSVKRALVGFHRDSMETARQIADNLHRLKGKFGPNHKTIELFVSDPVRSANNMVSALDSLNASSHWKYLVDITTFTHETLLILFRILTERTKPNYQVTLAYSTAEEYCPNVALEQKWLSYGVSDVRSVFGYPGEVLPGRKNHLIVLVGYESNRASELIKAYEPNAVSLGYGALGSGTESANEGSSQYFAKLVRQTISTYCPVNEFTFTSNNPIEAMASVLEQTKITPEYNHIVAPMNTKLSTIGAALATMRDPSIQLCYARALRYNTSNYSSPGKNCDLLELSKLL